MLFAELVIGNAWGTPQRLTYSEFFRGEDVSISQTTQQGSYLFTIRFWQEELGNGRFEWRGEVRFIPTGEVCYFRDIATLVKHIQTLLVDIETSRLQP